MSKRCELQKEYYKEFGNYKGSGKYTDHYVNWLESRILVLTIPVVSNWTVLKKKIMNKLPSFEYKKMIFHNVKDNLFQTDKFGDKLIYKYENGQYHLVRDERLSSVITLDEISKNPFSYNNDDNNWK